MPSGNHCIKEPVLLLSVPEQLTYFCSVIVAIEETGDIRNFPM
jgi:hypothetical protein